MKLEGGVIQLAWQYSSPHSPNSFPKRQGITGLEENAMQFTKKVQDQLLSPAPISFDYF